MNMILSKEISTDALQSVVAASRNNGLVVVSAIAEEVRLRNVDENIAREDIETLVVQFGTMLGAIMEISTFDDTSFDPDPAYELPWGFSHIGLASPVRELKVVH